MRILWVLLLLAPGMAFAAAQDGREIVLHGNGNGALPCAACHGVDGAGKASTGAPALAGLPAASIQADLARIAQGGGNSALMQSIAQALSPAERAAVAAYFSGLASP
ncbi:MAG TPA: c-type cytochrome [Acidocella sp.]|nr:MAG: hypothetical protein B7Z81_00585 [Acidocella sp. 20-61-6]HQT45693.1 c-type cytochrome [Acidocella sp.]